MSAEIKRDDAGRIAKRLLECHLALQKENVYSCLTAFREVLDKLRSTRMLPADEKQLHQSINAFQYELASSRAFRHLYGPVTFKDDDFDTSLEFIGQLIQIKEEEILATMEEQNRGAAAAADRPDIQERVEQLMLLTEKGDFASAREMADKDEEAADALLEMYNVAGIESRKQRDFEKAVLTFKKALFVRPEDEGLYYNLARCYLEAGDWKAAKNTIDEGLKSHPDFAPGIQLQAFIVRKFT